MKNTNKKNNASINIDDIFGHDRKELDNCFEICYTEHDGLLYPDFVLPKQTHFSIGKYGSLRLAFIKEHRKAPTPHF